MRNIFDIRDVLGDHPKSPIYIETLPRRGYRFIGGQEHFADGLTEALITTLAKIGQLRVISRTSSMLYKGVSKPVKQIARELQVETIVEGTVLRVSARVRITAQLIDAGQEEKHLWAESYERDLSNILALQAEVAQAIARQVHVKLSPQEEADLAQAHRIEPEAYDAYLKGRYHRMPRLHSTHRRGVAGQALAC